MVEWVPKSSRDVASYSLTDNVVRTVRLYTNVWPDGFGDVVQRTGISHPILDACISYRVIPKSEKSLYLHFRSFRDPRNERSRFSFTFSNVSIIKIINCITAFG